MERTNLCWSLVTLWGLIIVLCFFVLFALFIIFSIILCRHSLKFLLLHNNSFDRNLCFLFLCFWFLRLAYRSSFIITTWGKEFIIILLFIYIFLFFSDRAFRWRSLSFCFRSILLFIWHFSRHGLFWFRLSNFSLFFIVASIWWTRKLPFHFERIHVWKLSSWLEDILSFSYF